MNERSALAGVSFYDVATAFRSVGRAHNGSVDAVLSLPVREVSGISVDVRVRFRRRHSRRGDGWFERGISGVFPSIQNRTLAGLLLRLTLELDAKLTEEEETAKRSVQTRMGF